MAGNETRGSAEQIGRHQDFAVASRPGPNANCWDGNPRRDLARDGRGHQFQNKSKRSRLVQRHGVVEQRRSFLLAFAFDVVAALGDGILGNMPRCPRNGMPEAMMART